MVTDLCRHLTNRGEHGIKCMPCSSRIIIEMPLEIIQLMELFDFLKSIINSGILKFSVACLLNVCPLVQE